MSTATDWISAIANATVALGLLLTLRQINIAQNDLRHNKAEMSGDHERSRREKAIELIGDWARNLNQRATVSRKLAETLTFDQAKALYKQEAFSVSENRRGLLGASLASDAPPAQNKEIHLTEEHSAEIRWQVVTYLNNLEAILSAWRHNVADRHIIEEQFRYLVSPKDHQYILAESRKAAGGSHTYPAIAEFVKHIEDNYTSAPRPPIA